jgi:hypothetical protein
MEPLAAVHLIQMEMSYRAERQFRATARVQQMTADYQRAVELAAEEHQLDSTVDLVLHQRSQVSCTALVARDVQLKNMVLTLQALKQLG